MNWENIKQKIVHYAFIVPSILLAIVYFVFDRKTRNLQQVIDDTQRKLIDEKLNNVHEKEATASKEFNDKVEAYNKLRDKYRSLSDKLQLGPKKD
jgi:hypothetical protein